MTVSMNPYLHFSGEARAALEFYRSVLGGEVQIMTFGDMGAEGPVPAPEHVMHGYLGTPDGLSLMVSDGADGGQGSSDPNPAPSSGLSIALSGDDVPTLERWFAGLSEGGVVDVPLEKQLWGDLFGQVTDRFGVRWLVNASLGSA
ncbi:VOC family protein [Pseudonocardia phyllosphaerae]|uniref:VOC family protein n=1 Tax=Pseudonocardia phyllosphaerae TaxID=3390502 RepID=UPI00397DF8F8